MSQEAPTPKPKYRVKNWSAYDSALVRRGSLTLWLDEAELGRWREAGISGRRGASNTYSDWAIQCALTLGAVYRLTLRSTQGLMESLFGLMAVDLPVPDHTTLSRRRQRLEVTIPRTAAAEPRHLVIDSTGLKVYGEGEWKVRQHGVGKRRVWRKLHLAIDAATHEVVACQVTEAGVGDGEVLTELLEQVDGALAQVSADGAYDTRACHAAILARGAQAAIPPRAKARPWAPLADGRAHPRTQILQVIAGEGRKGWKRASGYHRRSLAETGMGRQKGLFGARLGARGFEAQVAECHLRVAAQNRMTQLGMPVSYAVHG